MAKRKTDTPKRAESTATHGKRVTFDLETWQALDLLVRDRMMTFQELADEAFGDVLKKHGRPMDVLDALKKSARAAATPGAKPTDRRKRKPAGSRRVS